MKNFTKNTIIFYPLLIIAGVIFLDLSLNISVLLENGRKERTPIEVMGDAFSYLLKTRASVSEKPYVFILGTSRSDAISYMSEQSLNRDAFTSQKEKSFLKKYEFDYRLTVRQSDMFVHYYFLNRALKTRVRPGLIVLELSPEMFNKNSPRNFQAFFYENVLDKEFLKEMLKNPLEKEIKREILFREFFNAYRYRFSPFRMLKHSIQKNNSDSSIAMNLLLLKNGVQTLNENVMDSKEGSIPENIYKERFLQYTDYIKYDSFLRNYVFDKSEESFFYRFILLCGEYNIPVLVYTPPVEKSLIQAWKDAGYYDHHKNLTDFMSRNKVPYIDFTAENNKCRYFVDSSHISGRCAPSYMFEIMKKASQYYPGL